MRLVAPLMQRLMREVGPQLGAALSRILYSAGNVQIGPGLKADRVPRCLIDPTADLVLGRGVELRAGVELRVHGRARVEIGDNVRIDRGVRILASNTARVTIGSGTRIGLGSVLNGGASISIGRDSLISGYVYVQTSMHRYEQHDRAIKDQGYDHAPVSIGDGAWIAAHVVVMPGITVGANAVVGSNAVVTRDVAPMSIVAGVPARPIGQRTEYAG